MEIGKWKRGREREREEGEGVRKDRRGESKECREEKDRDQVGKRKKKEEH